MLETPLGMLQKLLVSVPACAASLAPVRKGPDSPRLLSASCPSLTLTSLPLWDPMPTASHPALSSGRPAPWAPPRHLFCMTIERLSPSL